MDPSERMLQFEQCVLMAEDDGATYTGDKEHHTPVFWDEF